MRDRLTASSFPKPGTGRISLNSRQGIFLRELEQNMWTTWSTFGRGPGCALHESDEILWFETPIPIVPFNGVLRFRPRRDVDTAIDRIVTHFREREVQFMWVHHPSAEPPDLPERLAARGMMEVELMPGMARTLDDLEPVPAPPEGIEIRRVEDEADAAALYQFAAWRWQIDEQYQDDYAAIADGFRFGQPGSSAQIWQAWKDGNPVAKAGVYLSSGSAGIYAVATRPEARRLGLAKILTLVALHYARDRGHRTAVLHSTPMAEGLYRSMGFANVAEFRLFASDEVHI